MTVNSFTNYFDAVTKNSVEIVLVYIKQAFTASTFSEILAVLRRPNGFLFNVDPVALKLATHNKIVFQIGMESCLSNPKCRRNALCTAVTNALFLK